MFGRSVFNLKTVLNIIQFKKMCSIKTPSSLKKTIAISHMLATNDKKHNKEQVEQIVRMSKERQAGFIFLPECCDFVGTGIDETIRLSEPLNGETITFYKSLAKQHNVWLSLGGIHESRPNDSKIHNTHLIIDNTGKLIANYRKLHLFDVDTKEFKFRESKAVKGGQEIIPPLDTPIGQLGLMICYDLRFPELSTLLCKQGANILTYPSAFAYSTGVAHWEIMLRARAIENQCYVIASAQIGFHNQKRQSYGHAMVIDPWGTIIAQCDNNKQLDVATTEIDLAKVDAVRLNMPCFEHRRNDIYSLEPVRNTIDSAVLSAEFYFASFVIPESTIFYKSEHSIAFTNIRCVVLGHVLVATRRHVARITELTAIEISDLFQTACRVQKITELYYGTTSSTLTIQDGELAGQTVPHVHCHIMPRREGDFTHNDDIYVELNRHDCGGDRRTIEEMSLEAEQYRKIVEAVK